MRVRPHCLLTAKGECSPAASGTAQGPKLNQKSSVLWEKNDRGGKEKEGRNNYPLAWLLYHMQYDCCISIQSSSPASKEREAFVKMLLSFLSAAWFLV